MWEKIKPYIKHYVAFFVIVLFLILGYRYFWYRTKVVVKPVIKTLTKVVTKTKYKYKTLTATKIEYIPKVEYKTQLPAWLKGAENKILTTGVIPSYGGETVVTALLNAKTGKGSLAFEQLPYLMPKHAKPFFQLPNIFHISAGIGYLTDRNGTIKSELVGIKYNFLRIGNFNFKAQDNIYLNSRNTVNFAGIVGQYKF